MPVHCFPKSSHSITQGISLLERLPSRGEHDDGVKITFPAVICLCKFKHLRSFRTWSENSNKKKSEEQCSQDILQKIRACALIKLCSSCLLFLSFFWEREGGEGETFRWLRKNKGKKAEWIEQHKTTRTLLKRLSQNYIRTVLHWKWIMRTGVSSLMSSTFCLTSRRSKLTWLKPL